MATNKLLSMQRPDEKKALKDASEAKQARTLLNRAIRDGEFAHIYVLYGDEDYLRAGYRRALTHAISGDDEMNTTRFRSGEFDFNAFCDAADTMPFFADRRVIVIEDSGLFNQDCDNMIAYLEHLPDTTYVIFSESSVDKRYKLFKAVQKMGGVLAELPYQTPQELISWIGKNVQKDGSAITIDAAEELLSRIGIDMNTLSNELDKLKAFAADDAGITVKHLDQISGRRLEDRIFLMIDAAASGNKDSALKMYAELLALHEAPIKILVLIGRHIYKLTAVRQLLDEGLTSSEISRRCDLRFSANAIMAQTRRLSAERLQELSELSVLLDYKIKTGDISDQLAVELLLISLSIK